MKPKELLALKPGKIYVMKYHPAFLSKASFYSFIQNCADKNITIIPLATEDLNKVKFEEKNK